MLWSDVIKVTEDDIKKGEPQSSKFCAIALAVDRTIIRHLNNSCELEPVVEEDGDMFIRNIKSGDVLYQLHTKSDQSTLIYSFINYFDNGEDVEPIEFDFSLKKYGEEVK